jgi:hypothetical protein
MNKTQKDLIEKLYSSNRYYRQLIKGVNQKFINLNKLNEINQAYKLAEIYPDKFEVKCISWRCVDLIDKTSVK